MSRRLFASDEKAKQRARHFESRSFADDGEEYTESSFGGVHDYARRKRIKLQNQDVQLRSQHAESEVSKIFRGCVITVLGYTNPNSSIIHQLTVKNGGIYHQYMDGKTNVTHIIATNLPSKKRVEFARYKVVHPGWLIESIRAGKLLDWSNYRVITEHAGQARLALGGNGPALVKGKGPEANIQNRSTPLLDVTQLANLVPKPSLTAKKDREIPASDEEGTGPSSEWEKNSDGEFIPPSHQPERAPSPDDNEESEEEIIDEVFLVGMQSFREAPSQSSKPPVEKVPWDVSFEPTVSFVEEVNTKLKEVQKDIVKVAPVSFADSEPAPTGPSGIINGVEAYDAECILGEKKHPANGKPKNKRGKKKYLVKWKGYDQKEATWEWEDTLREDLGIDILDEMVNDYRALNGIEPLASSTDSQKCVKKSSSKKRKSLASSPKFQSTKKSLKKSQNHQPAQKLNTSDTRKNTGDVLNPTLGSIILPESFSSFALSQTTIADNTKNLQQSPIRMDNDLTPVPRPMKDSIKAEVDDHTLPIPEATGPTKQYSLLDEIPDSLSSFHLSQMSDVVNSQTVDPLEKVQTTPPPSPLVDLNSSPPVVMTFDVANRKRTGSLGLEETPKKKAKSVEPNYISPQKGTTPTPTKLTNPGEIEYLSLEKIPMRIKPQTAEEFNAILLANHRVRDATVLNPNFLTKFFQESRLHRLSTWKSELRSKMQALALKSHEEPPIKGRPRKYVMHVDFDCFFAAVSIRDRPELKDKPVAICHGNSENSTSSEIASCNYVARSFGVKNGSWMAAAKKLCPDLICMGYEFDKYEEASEAFYKVIVSVRGERVQAVSIDEALIDISNRVCDEHITDITQEEAKAVAIATKVRSQCRESSGCEVSVGIGPNIPIARLALRKAKPAGQYIVSAADAMKFLEDQSVSAFPGVGRNITSKVHEKFGVDLVREIRNISKERLRQALGPKTGEKIYELCRGIDITEVGEDDAPRQSISVDVNWGVRFTHSEQAEKFVMDLATEVQKRMNAEGVKGKSFSIKVAKRAKDASFETEKFLGCGKCESTNKSFIFNIPTADGTILGKKAVEMLRACHISPGELRGIGLSMKGLEDDKKDQEKQKTLNFGEFQVKEKKPVEGSVKIKPPSSKKEPEQWPAQEMRINPYVKPKVTTLMDIFAKRTAAKKQVEKKANQAIPTPPVKGSQLVVPESSKLEKQESSPKVFTQYEIPTASQIDLSVLEALPTPVRQNILKAQPVEKKEIVTYPTPKQSGLPQVTPRFISTQFELPSASQIDPSVWESLGTPLRNSITDQQKAKENLSKVVIVQRGLEQPPSAQWDIVTWNELPQDLRDEQRREFEAEQRVEEKYKEKEGKALDSPRKLKQQTLFHLNPPKDLPIPFPPVQKSPSKNRGRKANPDGVIHPLMRMPKVRRVYDAHGKDVTPWLFTEAGIDPEWFFGLDEYSKAAEIRRCVKEREKAHDARVAIINRDRQRQYAIDNAVRVKVCRLRPTWINSTLPDGLPILSSNPASIKSGIQCWARTEEPDEDDVREWCGFLKDTVLAEKCLAKAVSYVRHFLVMAGEKEGWCEVCDLSVAAINEAVSLKGLPPVEFD